MDIVEIGQQFDLWSSILWVFIGFMGFLLLSYYSLVVFGRYVAEITIRPENNVIGFTKD